MTDSINSREHLIANLKEDILGPQRVMPEFKPLDCTKDLIFHSKDESYGPWVEEGTGEEILHGENPTTKYGAGILFPFDLSPKDIQNQEYEDAILEDEDINERVDEIIQPTKSSPNLQTADLSGVHEQEQDHDFDITGVNGFRPSSMGVSFMSELPAGSELVVHVTGGKYIKKQVTVVGSNRTWWLRRPVAFTVRFRANQLSSTAVHRITPASIDGDPQMQGLDIRVEAYARDYDHQSTTTGPIRLMTVCLINRTDSITSKDEASLFQAWFKAEVITPELTPAIIPYPSSTATNSEQDPEIRSLSLLFRKFETYGVGHGCAADWLPPEQIKNSPIGRVPWVSAEAMPVCEVPSITPDIRKEDNSLIQVPMRALAGLDGNDDGFNSVLEVVESYRKWINEQRNRTDIPIDLKDVAEKHIQNCSHSLLRIEKGITYLKSDPIALQAFQLANKAVLLQQLASSYPTRTYQYNTKNQAFEFSSSIRLPDSNEIPPGRGNWRPFQIAFILTCLASTGEPTTEDRETVELLWFPTGGGKTEAYLGLTAFAIFLRRLRNPTDIGVSVLMRYTLRLLTSQQFQRASSLISAMEMIRRDNPAELGESPVSIGLWLGGGNTPNNHPDALNLFNQMRTGKTTNQSMGALECPWCRAQIGPVRGRGWPKGSPRVIGYNQHGNKIRIGCSDKLCPFYEDLPLVVVDEYIYQTRPDLLIGTVDKFALLAWRPEARSLFGLGEEGTHEVSPPSLIIQDELHLISGPLGSMVGLYEGIIEELCIDRGAGTLTKPKIISSTATIRRSEQQINSLYGRADSVLFPPPGLDSSDSFFSKFATNERGELSPGKKYVGVYTPNLPSLQTCQVKTFSSLLQSPTELPHEERDPWWTLMAFFNNLKELGNSLSLVQYDIQNHMMASLVKKRRGERRYLYYSEELTGRLRDEDIPASLQKLSVQYTEANNRAIDACLASNIIEVGIDIDRLSLMTVVGQPKTTSQYIQVTGRVGRRWNEAPGLIVTIMGVGRPRDRSHFEKFRSYHERMYASVEPTSVTPFAPPVLDRALHACFTAYVRQKGPMSLNRPDQLPSKLQQDFKQFMIPRVLQVDPLEANHFEEAFNRMMKKWEVMHKTEWGRAGNIPGEDDLLTGAGSYIPVGLRDIVWPTPTSLRNVDAECEMEITRHYMKETIDQLNGV